MPLGAAETADKVPLSTRKSRRNSMQPFDYLATATLDDDSEAVLDLEERGWANKELLARVRRWAIVPKPHAPHLPIVVVNIPTGGKPVFKSRVFGTMAVGDVEDGKPVTPLFRCYAIGYKLGRRTHWTWVMPNGSIEVGDDPWLARVHLSFMKQIL